MKKVLQFGLAMGFTLFGYWVHAQFSVTGSIKDGTGEPLIGASVLVKGTTTGTATDLEGAFLLEIPGNSATLVITYTGYENLEMEVTSANPRANIVLTQSAEALSEVVVVGYGTTRKEALTGSVTSLRSEKLEQVPLASVEQALQGNVAGLQATTGSGQPGGNVQIRIRGIGSITASSEPLYVIDGIPVIADGFARVNTTTNPMASINPNDIESVTVLKDAAATSIYGARGANGVILITTKSGKNGKPKIDLRTQVGFNSWAVPEDRQLKGLTSREYTEMFLEGWTIRGETREKAISRFEGFYPGAVTFNDKGEIQQVNVETNWVDLIQRTGINQSYDLSISGGNDVVSYFVSGSYFGQESPIIYSGLDRTSSRINLTVNASPKLRITNNLTGSFLNQRGASDGSGWANPLYNSYFLAPVIPLKDNQGRFYGDHQNFFMGGNNPVGSLSGDDTREFDQIRVLDNFTAEYEITKGLIFKSAWAVDFINMQEFFFRNGRYGDGRTSGGSASESVINRTNWIGTQTLNFTHTFGESHNLSALVGFEAQKDKIKRVLAQGEGYPDPSLRTLASAATPTNATSDLDEYGFSSVLSRVDYNYNLKYYLTGTLRRDGSSRFGVNDRFGTFWSVGLSWRLSQEPFMQSIGFIDDLKLRSSIGTSGNAGIGNYDHLALFGFGADYDGVPGGAPTAIGNPSLTWEVATSFNVGLDFSVFNNVLSGTFEYFNRESDNLLLDRPISKTTGFTVYTQNFGAMKNSGLEVTLNTDVLKTDDWNISVGGNITFLKNRVTKLDEDIIEGTKIRKEGYDFQTYYLYEWAGVNPQDGKPQWYTDSTMTEITSASNSAKRFISGRSATPDFFGGFNTSVSFKGLTLDAQLSYSWGNYVYDTEARFLQGDGALSPRSQTSLNLKRWRQPGDVTDVPYFRWGGNNNSNLDNMTRWLFDASHVRLRNVTLGYNLPGAIVKKVKLRSARVYARGVNLLTFTKDKNLYHDPEAAISGIISSPIPNLKTISFGIDIGL